MHTIHIPVFNSAVVMDACSLYRAIFCFCYMSLRITVRMLIRQMQLEYLLTRVVRANLPIGTSCEGLMCPLWSQDIRPSSSIQK